VHLFIMKGRNWDAPKPIPKRQSKRIPTENGAWSRGEKRELSIDAEFPIQGEKSTIKHKEVKEKNSLQT